MKYGAAVVVGAIVMFVSGYMLGYTTAVPDILRANSLDLMESGPEPSVDDLDVVSEDHIEANNLPDGSLGETGAGEPMTNSHGNRLDSMTVGEMEALKRMLVPTLTDEEIKKYRTEAKNQPVTIESDVAAPASDAVPTEQGDSEAP